MPCMQNVLILHDHDQHPFRLHPVPLKQLPGGSSFHPYPSDRNVTWDHMLGTDSLVDRGRGHNLSLITVAPVH